MSIVLRLLTTDDEPFLWQMLYHAIYIPAGAPAPPLSSIHSPELARYVVGWGRTHDYGWLASDSTTGQPVGAIWLRLLVGDHQGYGFVDDQTPELSLAVLPNFRGCGIGTALLQKVCQSPYGEQAISLSVSHDNPAIRLYERCGFTVVDHDATSLVMVRDPQSSVS